MTQTQHGKRSEKGLLTPDNCAVAFIDHQPQMLFGTSNFDRQSIINNTVALARPDGSTHCDDEVLTSGFHNCWQTVRQSYEPVLTIGLNVLLSNLLASSSSCRLIVWGIPG